MASRAAANKNIFENVIFDTKKTPKKTLHFLQKEKKSSHSARRIYSPGRSTGNHFFLGWPYCIIKWRSTPPLNAGGIILMINSKKYTIKVIDSTHIAGIACRVSGSIACWLLSITETALCVQLNKSLFLTFQLGKDSEGIGKFILT